MKEFIGFLNELKPFIPFGSAVLGAITGGVITYNVFERKKMREKRLKSLFKLVAIAERLVTKASNTAWELKPHLSKQKTSEGLKESLSKFKHFILVDMHEANIEMSAISIYVNDNVVQKVLQSFTEIKEVYEGQRFAKIEDVKEYLETRIDNLDLIEEKLEDLVGFLRTELDRYCEKYMKKYIRD